MASYVAEAIVTGARRYGEADRLLTLFTRDRGKVAAIAKSARKPKSRIRAASESFVKARFELAEGRSLHIVRSAEILDPHISLRENWKSLQLAGHVAEIVNRMSEEGAPDPELYNLLDCALDMIGVGRADAVVRFKVALLDHLGIFPDLSGCSECGKSRVAGDVHLDQLNHGFLCGECAEKGHVYHPVPMKVLHLFHSMKNGMISTPEVEDDMLASADDVLTSLLQAFLQDGFKTAKAARHARSARKSGGTSSGQANESGSE